MYIYDTPNNCSMSKKNRISWTEHLKKTMKKLLRILSVITLFTLLNSCSQEKVSESQIKFNNETKYIQYLR